MKQYGSAMQYDYLALFIFSIISIFVPFSMLLGAKLLRHNSPSNPVKESPYESAEATSGKNRDIMSEYMPFFMLFLPIEIIAVIILLWSSASRVISELSSILVIGMAAISLIFALFGYVLISGHNGSRKGTPIH